MVLWVEGKNLMVALKMALEAKSNFRQKLEKKSQICYNSFCLGERKTGRFAFKNAVTNHNILLWAKRPACVDSRPAVRLDNDGKHMQGALLCRPREKNQVNLYDQINAKLAEIGEGHLEAERYDSEGNLVCYYCGKLLGKRNTHRDHITPKSRGGLNLFWNIALVCASCNLRKSIRHPFFALKHVPDDLQLDYLARIVLGSVVTLRRYSLGDSAERVEDASLLDVGDKLSVLSEQLQQVTKWMHMLEQEVETLATTRKNQSDQNDD